MRATRQGRRRTKRPPNAWKHERRTYVIYALSPDAGGLTWAECVRRAAASLPSQRRPISVYLGMTSVGLPKRLRQHQLDASRNKSTCRVHEEMRKREGWPWKMHELQRVQGTYPQAKRREEMVRAQYAQYPGIELLNRRTLACE